MSLKYVEYIHEVQGGMFSLLQNILGFSYFLCHPPLLYSLFPLLSPFLLFTLGLILPAIYSFPLGTSFFLRSYLGCSFLYVLLLLNYQTVVINISPANLQPVLSPCQCSGNFLTTHYI